MTGPLKEKFEKLKDLLLIECQQFYGERLVSVVIFGSVARGTYSPESDLDVLIVAEALPPGRMKRIEEFLNVEKRLEPFLVALKKDNLHTEISPVFKTPQEAMKGSLLFLDMVEDAVILLDRDQFFGRLLERLRQRLKELGARRVWRGDVWHWVLKPDYKPGEEFTLF